MVQLIRTYGSELRSQEKRFPQNMNTETKSSTCSLIQGQSQGDKQFLLFWHLFQDLKALSFCLHSECYSKAEITLERTVSVEMMHQIDNTTAVCTRCFNKSSIVI